MVFFLVFVLLVYLLYIFGSDNMKLLSNILFAFYIGCISVAMVAIVEFVGINHWVRTLALVGELLGSIGILVKIIYEES